MANIDKLFPELVLGLALYTQEHFRWANSYPAGLIRAMNGLALLKGADFPKTFTAFLRLCHQPVEEWYPGDVENFTKAYRLLINGQLSEQASDYLYSLPADLVEQHQRKGYVPGSVLDNWEMQQFIQHLHNMDDSAEAQRIYVTIRSFLIEHSWITRRDLNALKRQNIPDDFRDLLRTKFYEPDDRATDFYVCERCGILQIVDDQLIGIKPGWCGEHRPGLPHVQEMSTTEYARLKRGIHMRTFIPGQAERELFQQAEQMLEEFAGHLTRVERYPGLDAYDLRLTFRDGEIWAVDVKDIADPFSLAAKIQPLHKRGALRHDMGWYVVPDRRIEMEAGYLEQVRHARAVQPPLHLEKASDFYAKLRAKCNALVNASR
jgi:hypothetical protein